jgi:hypothetical protein
MVMVHTIDHHEIVITVDMVDIDHDNIEIKEENHIHVHLVDLVHLDDDHIHDDLDHHVHDHNLVQFIQFIILKKKKKLKVQKHIQKLKNPKILKIQKHKNEIIQNYIPHHIHQVMN